MTNLSTKPAADRSSVAVATGRTHRDPILDNLKGLLIALVVAGHLLENVPVAYGWRWPEGWHWPDHSPWKSVYCLIALVHMPAFAFVSGYLSSSRKTFLAHARELLSLYVLCQIFWCGFLLLLSLMGGKLPGYRELFLILPGPGLWYLLCLFIWRTGVPLLEACRFPRFALVALVGAGAALGLVSGVGEDFSLSRLIAFAPFFAGGFWCRHQNWGLTARAFRWPDALLFIVALAGGAWVVYEAMHRTTDLLKLANPYATFGFLRRGVFFRLAYYLGAFGAIRAAFLFVPKGDGWLTQLGQASLSVYIGHFYMVQALRVFLPASFWPAHIAWLTPLLVITCCFVFCSWRFGDHLARLAARSFDCLFASPGAPPHTSPAVRTAP